MSDISKAESSGKKVASEEYNELELIIDKKIKLTIPEFYDRFYELPKRVVKLLLKTISKTPWLNRFVVYAIMMNEEGESASLYNRLSNLNSLFRWATEQQYTIDSSLDIKKIFLEYKKCGFVIGNKLVSYNSFLTHSHRFLDDYSSDLQSQLQEYLLPEFNSDISDLYRIRVTENEKTQQKKQKQTAPLKKNITNLVAIARTRCEWMLLLHSKINTIKQQLETNQLQLPCEIEMPNFDRIGSLSFRVWNKAQWVIHHSGKYSKATYDFWVNESGLKSTEIFIQFIGEPRSPFFFLRALQFGFLHAGANNRNQATVDFSIEQNIPLGSFRDGLNSGILIPDRKIGEFLFMAKKRAIMDENESSILFQAEPLISGAIIGYLAVLIISLTGMRISEIQQLCLEKSIKYIQLPQFNQEENAFETESIWAYVFEIYTKGKIGLQKTYAPEVIIDAMKMFMKFHLEVHGRKLQPIKCNSVDKQFSLERFFMDKEYTFLFQWRGVHLTNQTINKCIYFILLEHNLIDEDGNVISLSSHTYRHGFAGYLKQKGVPLERIAKLLHHVNSLVTDYYSHEPDEVILEQLYSLINEIGGELRIEPGVIRSIDDIQRFEQECLKRFGALRKVIGGKCGVYCSCEADFMCARCNSFIPQSEKRHEIISKIEGCDKVADFYEKSDQHVMAERLRINSRNWKISLAELDSWSNILEFEKHEDSNELFGEIENNPELGLDINPLLPPKSQEPETPSLDEENDD